MDIILDIYTQNDFFNEGSPLCIENADRVRKNINTVLITGMRNDMVIAGTLLAHSIGQELPPQYIPHCIIGDDGYDKIWDTVVVEDSLFYTVANIKHGMDVNIMDECWQIYFETQGYDIWDDIKGQPDNLGTLLRTEEVKTVYIVGVAINTSVLRAAQGLIDRLYNVVVINDAIGSIERESAFRDPAINHMREIGVDFMSTEEFEFKFKVTDED